MYKKLSSYQKSAIEALECFKKERNIINAKKLISIYNVIFVDDFRELNIAPRPDKTLKDIIGCSSCEEYVINSLRDFSGLPIEKKSAGFGVKQIRNEICKKCDQNNNGICGKIGYIHLEKNGKFRNIPFYKTKNINKLISDGWEKKSCGCVLAIKQELKGQKCPQNKWL